MTPRRSCHGDRSRSRCRRIEAALPPPARRFHACSPSRKQCAQQRRRARTLPAQRIERRRDALEHAESREPHLHRDLALLSKTAGLTGAVRTRSWNCRAGALALCRRRISAEDASRSDIDYLEKSSAAVRNGRHSEVPDTVGYAGDGESALCCLLRNTEREASRPCCRALPDTSARRGIRGRDRNGARQGKNLNARRARRQ